MTIFKNPGTFLMQSRIYIMLPLMSIRPIYIERNGVTLPFMAEYMAKCFTNYFFVHELHHRKAKLFAAGTRIEC